LQQRAGVPGHGLPASSSAWQQRRTCGLPALSAAGRLLAAVKEPVDRRTSRAGGRAGHRSGL